MVFIVGCDMILMIIACTIICLSLFIICLLCFKSCDPDEEYRREDGVSEMSNPIEQNIPLASIQDILDNHLFLQNENELTQGTDIFTRWLPIFINWINILS